MSSDPLIVIRQTGEPPDLVALHELNPQRYPYLLQSVAKSTHHVQFDILFAFPQQTHYLKNNGELYSQAGEGEEKHRTDYDDFLAMFDSEWKSHRAGRLSTNQLSTSQLSTSKEIPFRTGWFLFLGYELAQQIEPSLKLPKDTNSDFPVAFATHIPAAIIINRNSGDWFLIAEPEFSNKLSEMEKDIDFTNKKGALNNAELSAGIIRNIFEEPDEKYLASVKRVKNYIKNGDVFQVNLSRLWRGELTSDVSDAVLYRRLMQTNPAPFFALATFDQHAIISSSPERLVKVSGGRIETRPIAGTRPRGETQRLDAEKLQELIGHPKERAEHIMLIDLERNDLGRVCKPGTVDVNELMTLETYAHVHHIVSNIQGTLRDDTTPGEIIRAVFPGGTITGCPKVRCMEIIAELEAEPRGAYTGSVGYVNHDGSMDFNILIRTVVKSANQISLRAGAGIVADSIPEKELEETRAKAKGLLLAL